MNVYQHILVAVDFTDSVSGVIERAQQMAEKNNAKLTLVHVVEPAPVDFLDQTMLVDINLDELLLKTAKQQMQTLAEKFSVSDTNTHIEIGSVKSEIIKLVESQSVDLIVVGSHGRHGLGLLLGSTANAVLHGAPCDVLAVRVDD